MSFQNAEEPVCTACEGEVAMVIEPKARDLGEFTVRRVLPSAQRQMVGPFIFFDHMGPTEFAPGEGIQVRPHPHIGLATMTYLFEGEIMHRDSLGYAQPIRAGAVNLMTAGRGIVHSERAGDDLNVTSKLHGIQSWMALPEEAQETEPSFVHYPASEMTGVDVGGANVKVVIGKAFGLTSPVETHSPALYLDVRLPAGTSLIVDEGYEEMAAYVVDGQARIGGESYGGGVMAVGVPGQPLGLHGAEDARVIVIGGSNLGRRRIWWNFVSSSPERIEQAKADWKEGRFDKVQGEEEFIPLPER